MPKNTPPPPEKKPRNKLDREKVLQHALNIADQEGIQALTMRKLAQDLGVEAMSLYHHFANKERLMDGMIDLVFIEIEMPTKGHWKDRIRTRAISARQALKKHPWAVGLMESRTSPGAITLYHHNKVIECFRTSGFSIPATAHAYAFLDSFIFGFILQEIQLPFSTFEDAGPAAKSIMFEVFKGEFPYLTELATEHVMQPGYNYAREFDIGLEIVLDGIEKMKDVY